MSSDLRPRAVLFDLYGTLIDIQTREDQPEVWDRLARFLRYRGLMQADAGALYHGFFEHAQRVQRESTETHPEVDNLAIFDTLLQEMGCDVPGTFAEEVTQLFRTLSMVHFGLFPDTLETLEALKEHCTLGLVSDAQRVFLEPEITMAGLKPFLDVVVISSVYGYHKPDTRLFDQAIEKLGMPREQVLFVGDNVPRDVCGAKAAGLKVALIDRNGKEPGEDELQPDVTLPNLQSLREWLLSLPEPERV
jgi:putative hydrolase of the HAD superfamily